MPPPRGTRFWPWPRLWLLVVLVSVGYDTAQGFVVVVPPPTTATTTPAAPAQHHQRHLQQCAATTSGRAGAEGSEGGEEPHWREVVRRLSGAGGRSSSKTASGGGDGKQQSEKPRVLLGSGAFHLEANRTRLLADAMREHFGDTAEAPRLLFIPFAAADGDYDAYVKRTIELGLNGGYELDSIHLHPDPVKAVREAKGIYIGGGNAFRLLQQLRAHKLLEPIRERVLTARVPFLGVSAGAVVACPTIRTSNDMPVCDPGGLDALGLVDFQLSAHFFAGDVYVKAPGTGDWEMVFGGNREGKIKEYLANNDSPVVGLAEGYILKCYGPRVELLGGPSLRGGALKIFRKEHAALEWEGMGGEDLGPLIRGEGHMPVPLSALFGNPHKTQARVSPDGRWISYLAPSREGKGGGVMNVWVVERHRGVDATAGGEARMVTHDRKRGIQEHFWAEDSQHLLYLQDSDGDENWHLFKVTVTDEQPTARDLTPFEGVRAQNVLTSRRKPDELLVGLNLRSRAIFDVHRIDLATGACALDTENPGDVVSWHTDRDFNVRAALAADAADGGRSLRVRDRGGDGGAWRTVQAWGFEESGSVVGWNAEGDGLYILSSLGSDTTRLVELDAATGKERATLVSDPRCDVGSVLVNDETLRIEAVEFNYEVREWRVLDAALGADFASLEAAVAREGRREFRIVSRTHDDGTWVVAVSADTGPTEYHMYHRSTQALDLLFVDRPALLRYRLGAMRPVVIPTSDGLSLVSYLTLPPAVPASWRPGLDPPKALGLPLVLLVHGGPWARDSWGFDPLAQLFSSRGYAVLQVNFRASSGFGKRFVNAGNGEWGTGAMQRDLTEAVGWAVAWGVADKARVAIMGASYGGYATLAGLCFTPDLYACGIAIVGPAHLKTLFESIPPYWRPLKAQLVRRVGDAEHDRALNERISPIYHAKHVRAPLLLLQGSNDPRVKKAESDQMVQSLRNVGTPVTYVVYPDEGHGFVRPANKMDAYAKCEAFLARHLGGLYVPPEDPDLFEGTTAMLE